jgi:hypothetical protein
VNEDPTELDPLTIAYLERVTSKRGQAAVEAWLKNVGWRDETESAERVWREAKVARASDPAISRTERYSARHQIPVAERLKIAVARAVLDAKRGKR